MARRWRVARSLTQLKSEVNAKYPGRPTGSDGTIGNADHSARTSDHNPNGAGVVCAIDLTEWVVRGVEMNDVLAEELRASRDSRIKYVISDGRMFSSYNSIKNGRIVRRAWEWGPYSGPNKHTKHVHISVKGDYDSTARWLSEEDYTVPPTISLGTLENRATRKLRGLLMADGFKLHTGVSGNFGPGLDAVVKEYQRNNGLDADGIVGPMTWRSLIEKED